ncbi:UDP-N-acetylmuramoyl-tripeptide--D-alanyl-D-alanine ligase [Desulfonatronum sp. SC1]|uniref:UDP-N-acetylmuramoyl-tripeptide--D-alanyl-D- alanine ligase n=1 Tax=Desulfonatronum sp. SC1 TaxID=2109626 RepID=UPI000D304709|nr:UDP-N-acetylmuramoyl-tripeptide--D-alanyl-D-alanine ligase [Desulfonatronum sp. SC1]PTN33078.1 UDP-N-acetylmuramoylalanyl-D-glutamyl-2, 6-diaminopimelate--D-alanyl-D-alanine ligase [Desulfonatronum sp. SC1]
MRMSLRHIAGVLGLTESIGADGLSITGVGIDSRDIRPGDLFFCLPGERSDGHQHAAQAVDNGAVAVMATRDVPELNGRVPVLMLREGMTAQAALGEVASAWREEFTGRVVGVTGSAGKTTVKEMVARVCSRGGTTCRNRLNWNNQIGLPLSLLSCSGEEDFWIMEAGISRPGDMDDLGAILRPDLAVLLNVGPAHLAELGGVPGVAAAKARLAAYLSPEGRALVNRDCPDLWRESEAVTDRIHGFSTRDPDAEFWCGDPFRIDSDRMGLELRLQGRGLSLSWPTERTPVAQNVLATAAAATLLGIDPAAIQEGLSVDLALPGRFNVERRGDWFLVDDTYNANPLSMRLALSRARALTEGHRLVCVLGDMLELGASAKAEHHDLGRTLAGVCSEVYYHGAHGADVRAGLAAEQASTRFTECESPQHFLEAWRKSALAGKSIDEADRGESGGVILFKGSRAGKMETYLEALRTEPSA